jgi:conjugal transfer pilus assembly protein TraF
MPKTFSTKRFPFGSRCIPPLLTILLCTTAVASEPSDKTPALFYQISKQGWFWYQDPPVEKEPATQPSPSPAETLNDYSIEQLWQLHPDHFQALLDTIHKQAVQNPTEQNVLDYLTIQDIARRKALAYTHTAAYVTQKYSDRFRMNQVYPTAGPGVTARVQMQQQEITATIHHNRKNHALIYFTSAKCPYCDKQSLILRYFQEKYGWEIRPVDLSGNPAIAARFNISVTPTLLLIRQGNDNFMPVATGVVTLSELERRLYRAIRHLDGKTDVDQFLLYDFQANSALDPSALLKTSNPTSAPVKEPW